MRKVIKLTPLLIIFSWALSCGQNYHITTNSSSVPLPTEDLEPPFVEPSITIVSPRLNLGGNTISGACTGNGTISLSIQDTLFTDSGPCNCNGSSFSCSINITKIPCSDDPLEVTADLASATDSANLEIDFDNDGVINSLDLDDDNDGTLDHRYNYGDIESYSESFPGSGTLASVPPFTTVNGSVDRHTGNPTPMFNVNTPPISGNNYIAFHSRNNGQKLETWSIALAAPFNAGEKIKINMHVLVLDPGFRSWNNPSDIFFYGGTSSGDESILVGSVSTAASHLDGWIPKVIETTLTQTITHLTVYNVSHAVNESYVGIDGLGISKPFNTGGQCDIDTDNDGQTDLMESQFTAGIAADINNDGMIDLNESVDSDSDGIMDIFEGSDLSLNSGVLPIDTDSDVRKL